MKSARVFTFLLFLLTVIGLSFGFLINFKKQTKQIFTSPLSLTKPKPIEWETYRNDRNEYFLQHPKDWNMVEEWDIHDAANLTSIPDGSIWQQIKFKDPKGASFEVLVWENKSQISVRTWLSWFRHEDLILRDVPVEHNATVSAIPSIFYQQTETGRGKPLSYFFLTQKGKVYELVFENMDREIVERVVKNFTLK